MAALQPLQALNKSSGRLASFGVRAYGGTQVSYTYVSKRDQKSVTAHKFEVYLVASCIRIYTCVRMCMCVYVCMCLWMDGMDGWM